MYVFRQRRGRLIRPNRDATREHIGVLDTLSGALCVERQHWVSRIAQQHHPPYAPVRKRLAIVKRLPKDGCGGLDHGPYGGMPPSIVRQRVLDVALSQP